MNKVLLVGRLTRDPDVRYTNGENAMCIARFSVAVDRKVKKENQQNADFPSCIAFSKTGEFIEKYFKKGMRIGIEGHIQTGSYKDNNGNTVYTTDIVVEQCEFVESKRDDNAQPQPTQSADGEGFIPIQEELDDGNLPFL